MSELVEARVLRIKERVVHANVLQGGDANYLVEAFALEDSTSQIRTLPINIIWGYCFLVEAKLDN